MDPLSLVTMVTIMHGQWADGSSSAAVAAETIGVDQRILQI